MPSDIHRDTPLDCDGLVDLLDAHVDRALPGTLAEAVDRHLALCPSCAAEHAAIRTLRADLAVLARDTPPPELLERLRDAMPARRQTSRTRRRTVELAAAGLAGIALGAGVLHVALDNQDNLALHDLLAAHGRSLLGPEAASLHVASTDPHAVKPWLTSRLPLAPSVVDPAGFPLLGARLDLVGGQPVAALVHRRREHRITVFAAAEADTTFWPRVPISRRGFQLLPWRAGGIAYVAVSDLNAAELAGLPDVLRPEPR